MRSPRRDLAIGAGVDGACVCSATPSDDWLRLEFLRAPPVGAVARPRGGSRAQK